MITIIVQLKLVDYTVYQIIVWLVTSPKTSIFKGNWLFQSYFFCSVCTRQANLWNIAKIKTVQVLDKYIFTNSLLRHLGSEPWLSQSKYFKILSYQWTSLKIKSIQQRNSLILILFWFIHAKYMITANTSMQKTYKPCQIRNAFSWFLFK